MSREERGDTVILRLCHIYKYKNMSVIHDRGLSDNLGKMLFEMLSEMLSEMSSEMCVRETFCLGA